MPRGNPIYGENAYVANEDRKILNNFLKMVLIQI